LVPLMILLAANFGYAVYLRQVNDYVTAKAGTFDNIYLQLFLCLGIL